MKELAGGQCCSPDRTFAPKNILVFYDEKFTFIKTVEEHLRAFKNHSRNNCFFAPATVLGDPREGRYTETGPLELSGGKGAVWNLDHFDAVIVHYSTRLSIEGYIAPQIARRIRDFDGEKILFIQDEYESVDCARKYIEYLRIGTIYTCVPEHGRELVYPRSRFPDVEFIQTLTGFVPDEPGLELHAMPLRERKTLIGYRGRRLPHHYGRLGHEKFIIGERVKAEALKRDLPVDIECDDSKRIYGSWYKFLGSCRATLGTESGSNIFDFDNTLREKAAELADRPFDEVYDEHFRKHDDFVQMGQISPKFFEAIRLRTALVCFPGSYSGVLEPDRHYIPLERDFSNVDAVFDKLADVEFLEELTATAYRDVIESEKYSYKSFVSSFDDRLDRKVSAPRAEIISAPVAVRRGAAVEPLRHDHAADYLLSDHVLGGDWQRESFQGLFAKEASVFEPSRLAWINRAQVEHGAGVTASSPFHGAPHDAESLLRPFVPGDYAAVLDTAPLPHFVELDLGAERLLEGAYLRWYDTANHGIDYRIEVRAGASGWRRLFNSWRPVLEVRDNAGVEQSHHFPSVRARHVRLTVTKFAGQQRLLLRRFELYERQAAGSRVDRS